MMQIFTGINNLGAVQAEWCANLNQYHVYIADADAWSSVSLFFTPGNTPETHLFELERVEKHGLTIRDGENQVRVYSKDKAKVLELAYTIATIEDKVSR